MKPTDLAHVLVPLISVGMSGRDETDDDHCAYCGIKMRQTYNEAKGTSPTRDHVLAKAHGGQAVTVPACLECNQAKRSKSLPEFLAGEYFRAKRNPKHGRAWPEHELLAVYAVAVLRRTHEAMLEAEAKPKARPAPGANKVNASGSVPSSPPQARKG